MRPHQQRYLAEVLPAFALYALALLAGAWLTPRLERGWERFAIALLPLPSIAWVIVALLRRLLAKDELEQRIELVAIAVASACVGVGSFAWGLLDGAALVPHGDMLLVLPLLVLVYGMVKLWARWRYR